MVLLNFVNNAWVDGMKGMSLNFDGINDTIRLPTITGDHKTFLLDQMTLIFQEQVRRNRLFGSLRGMEIVHLG